MRWDHLLLSTSNGIRLLESVRLGGFGAGWALLDLERPLVIVIQIHFLQRGTYLSLANGGDRAGWDRIVRFFLVLFNGHSHLSVIVWRIVRIMLSSIVGQQLGVRLLSHRVLVLLEALTCLDQRWLTQSVITSLHWLHLGWITTIH